MHAVAIQPLDRWNRTLLAGVFDAYLAGRRDDAVQTAAAIDDVAPFRLRVVQDVPSWINDDTARLQDRGRLNFLRGAGRCGPHPVRAPLGSSPAVWRIGRLGRRHMTWLGPRIERDRGGEHDDHCRGEPPGAEKLQFSRGRCGTRSASRVAIGKGCEQTLFHRDIALP